MKKAFLQETEKKIRTTLFLSKLLCGSFGIFGTLNNHSSLSTVRYLQTFNLASSINERPVQQYGEHCAIPAEH